MQGSFSLEAGMTRLELAASAVTGQRSNQLSYTPVRTKRIYPGSTSGVKGQAAYFCAAYFCAAYFCAAYFCAAYFCAAYF